MHKRFFRFYICLLFLFGNISAFAQHVTSATAGARGLATANANLNYQDIYSLFSNQAGLAKVRKFSALAYSHNRFLLAELNTVGIGIAAPLSTGTVGLVIQHYGFSEYNEQKIGLSYSRILLDKVSIGAQFDFLTARIKEYGNSAAITFELGLQYAISDQLTAGFHLFNPIRATLLAEESLPMIAQFGLTYSPSDYLVLSAAMEQNSTASYTIKAGLEYLLLNRFFVRVGVQTDPSLFSLGVGYQLPKFTLNMAMSYHTVLGVSPAFGITMNGLNEKLRRKN